jgi:CheY-like chemotaxis protein
LALLAGRILLLADDSITIQKIVALTFAEEGIEVIAVSDGAEAIERLEETSPDLVLADVFMPRLNGYQVCEHIKQTERLRHIPVMLMVGSFEPFDEVEARRVGADDILTKPFQSIRTLMDKVAALLGRAPAADHTEETSTRAADGPPLEKTLSMNLEASAGTPAVMAQEANTQELPPPEFVPPPEEPMTTEELEITTADTRPLSPAIRDRVERLKSEEGRVVETVLETEPMPANLNTDFSEVRSDSFDEVLLDLDHFEPVSFDANDDVILDIDFDAPPFESPPAVQVHAAQTVVAVENRFQAPSFSPDFSPSLTKAPADELVDQSSEAGEPEFVAAAVVEEEFIAQPGSAEMIGETAPAMAVQEPAHSAHAELIPEVSPVVSVEAPGVSAPAGLITLEQLAPEVIDAIARRAVEQLSEKVVQEIGWEVVPQLADLMIKRKLEEQESQNK